MKRQKPQLELPEKTFAVIKACVYDKTNNMLKETQ